MIEKLPPEIVDQLPAVRDKWLSLSYSTPAYSALVAGKRTGKTGGAFANILVSA